MISTNSNINNKCTHYLNDAFRFLDDDDKHDLTLSNVDNDKILETEIYAISTMMNMTNYLIALNALDDLNDEGIVNQNKEKFMAILSHIFAVGSGIWNLVENNEVLNNRAETISFWSVENILNDSKDLFEKKKEFKATLEKKQTLS